MNLGNYATVPELDPNSQFRILIRGGRYDRASKNLVSKTP
jgi:hypothetical protein